MSELKSLDEVILKRKPYTKGQVDTIYKVFNDELQVRILLDNGNIGLVKLRNFHKYYEVIK